MYKEILAEINKEEIVRITADSFWFRRVLPITVK